MTEYEIEKGVPNCTRHNANVDLMTITATFRRALRRHSKPAKNSGQNA